MNISTIYSDVGLLIGVNVPKAMEPWDVISSADEGPFAVLRWVINGPMDIGPDSSTYLYPQYLCHSQSHRCKIGGANPISIQPGI